MLHVHCGDSSAALLRKKADGDPVVVWDELLTGGLLMGDPHSDDFPRRRAAFLSASTGGARTTKQCMFRLRRQQAALEQFRDHKETVLQRG
ncbi:MAG: hypothetical protein KAI66_25095 [Lentisphaeria bacterium]|nr:hypothetical protein [Lentisphaeria bacterium]